MKAGVPEVWWVSECLISQRNSEYFEFSDLSNESLSDSELSERERNRILRNVFIGHDVITEYLEVEFVRSCWNNSERDRNPVGG